MAETTKIYLDACCYIDMIQGDYSGKDSPGREDHCWFCRQALAAAKARKIQLYGSSLLMVECTYIKGAKDRKIADELIKDSFNSIFMSGHIMVPVMPTGKIITLARDLTWEHGLSAKPFDSLHLATAFAMKCSLFVTRDDKLLNNAAQIKDVLKFETCSGDGAMEWLPSEYRAKGLF